MQLLFIKQSSLGDIFHSFPALTEAMKAIPNLSIDWVVEEAFSEVPKWHPAVETVIPIAHRRWRQTPLKSDVRQEKKAFTERLKHKQYDLILDAQGLIKSALLVKKVAAPSYGLDWSSIRKEKVASWFYDHKIHVPQGQHAIHRLRLLWSKSLGYDYRVEHSLDYQLDLPEYDLSQINVDKPYVVGLHGTTWESKHWPEAYWTSLAKKITNHGLLLLLPWGNREEKLRAERIANMSDQVKILPQLGLTDLAGILKKSCAIVAVDTGLAHVGAALDVPMINLFGPTNAMLTAALGSKVITQSSDYACSPCMREQCQFKAQRLNPPCYLSLSPESIWEILKPILNKAPV